MYYRIRVDYTKGIIVLYLLFIYLFFIILLTIIEHQCHYF